MNSFAHSNLNHISAMAALGSFAYPQFIPSLSSIYRYSPPMTPAFLSYSPAKFSKTSFVSASCLLLPELSSRWTSCARKPRRLRIAIIASALKKLSDSETIPVPATEEAADEDIVWTVPSGTGVYAVYNKSQELQFIGISRNVAASILVHRKTVPEFCSAVKVGIVDEPDRAALTQAWKSWMEEHIESTGKVPPGNEKGNTTWVPAAPQSKKKPDLRLTPGRHVRLTVPLEQLVDKLVKENKVVAFIKGSRSAPQCGFSQRVIGILNSLAVDYESVDVLDEEYNHGLRDKLKEYSNWPTFPQVFVNGELVGGCDILTSMHEQGELGKLLKG